MSTNTTTTGSNLVELTADVVDRVHDLQAAKAKHPAAKDGGSLRAAKKEQAAARKETQPKAEKPKSEKPAAAPKLSVAQKKALRQMLAEQLDADVATQWEQMRNTRPELVDADFDLVKAEIARLLSYWRL